MMRNLIRLRVMCLLVVLLAVSTVLAHPTVVLGTLTSDPQTPQPGNAFTLTLELEDPTQMPIEDAFVIAEFRPEGRTDGPITVAEFAEVSAGRYQASTTLSQAGTYDILLRDQTYRQEETNAQITLNVGTGDDVGDNPEVYDFLFPPTAVGRQSVLTWLVWLIGVPVLAALVVTVLVLSRSQEPRENSKGP
jgi:hypothetical protein